MKLQLFSSKEKKNVSLDLKPDQTINIYLCGPTVYDHIHIGNLRPVIIFDILHRLLLHLNIKVNYVQNITDIDDKIIVRANKEKKTEKEVSDHYTNAYLANLIHYNILLPSALPRVTNYISEIQEFIFSLVEKKVAYQQNNEVLFRTGVNKDYGKLSKQNLEKLKPGTREINKTNKESNLDFVLWKKTEFGINWNSQWGFGRPGWHTECAVFIDKLFCSQTIDIHGGGNDLLFPHHENERIQYLVKNNRELSKVWLHIAHIHWKEEKMSKSLGNVIFAKHFAKIYGVNIFRYLILNSHYNQVINFSEELIKQAIDYVRKIKNLLKRLNFYLYIGKIKIVKQKSQKEEIINSLLNNLNTVKTLFFLEQIINSLNKSVDKRENDSEKLRKVINDFYFILSLLGFRFDLPSYSLEVKLLIKKWQDLRNKSDYTQADKIRKKLQEMDVL